LVNQHLAINDTKTVFFRKIFYADDGWHGESEKLQG
jgi:hypothetical protein